MAGVLRHFASLRLGREAGADVATPRAGWRGHIAGFVSGDADHQTAGQPAMPGADWSWRPAAWSEPLAQLEWTSVPHQAQLAGRVTLHHDGAPQEVSLCQAGPDAAHAAPFGLRVDLADFRGSYLSLAIAFPPLAARALRKRHLVRLAVLTEADLSQVIYARLNIRHGPNVDQIVRRLPETAEKVIDFDLGHSDLTEAHIAEAWADVILERPLQGSIVIRDVVVSRRARAAF